MSDTYMYPTPPPSAKVPTTDAEWVEMVLAIIAKTTGLDPSSLEAADEHLGRGKST